MTVYHPDPVEPEFRRENCRSCQAPIIWARTPARSMPVDADPADDGRIRLFERQGVVLARVVTDTDAARMREDQQAVPLRKSHFATCPQAADWRKRGR